MLDHAVIDSANPAHVAGDTAASADQAALISHIERLLRTNRPAAARPLVLALKHLAPGMTRAVELEARLLIDEGQPVAALAVLDACLALAPDPELATDKEHLELYLLRAEIHVGRGDLRGAVEDAAAAVMLDRAAAGPKLRLGVLLTQLGRYEEAIACLRESLNDEPHPTTFRGLARAYERCGRTGEAGAVLDQAIALWPADRELRAAAVMHAIRTRDFAGAVRQADNARRDGTTNSEIFAMMGHAYAGLGRHAEAAEAYRDAAKFAPEDRFLRLITELSATAGESDRIAPERIEVLFDYVAPLFDQNILSLGYRIPGLLRSALQEQIASGARIGGTGELAGPVLDLGCGTGLVALAIGDVAGPITGFDISSAMLQSARSKNLFAELRQGDLPDLLQRETRLWPVILAGDVLLYFGALETLLKAVADRLAPGGRFIFSAVELCPDADGQLAGNGNWVQTQVGRFAHADRYLAQSLQQAGLAVLSMTSDILRYEAEVPVYGWIVVAGHLGEAAESVA